MTISAPSTARRWAGSAQTSSSGAHDVGEVVATEQEEVGRRPAQPGGQLARAARRRRRRTASRQLSASRSRRIERPLDGGAARVVGAEPGDRRHPLGHRPPRRRRARRGRRAARGRRRASSRAAGSARPSRARRPPPCSCARATPGGAVAAGGAMPSRRRDVLHGVELEAAGEDAEPSEQPLLVGIEQPVRPLDRRLHRAVAAVGAAPAAIAAGAWSSRRVDDGGHAERRRARGGQLDGQRQAVEAGAQGLDRRPVGRRRAPRRPPPPARRNSSTAAVAIGSGRDGDDLLAVDAERLAAGRQRPAARGRPSSARRRPPRRASMTCSQLSTTSSAGPPATARRGRRQRRSGRPAGADGEGDGVDDVIGIGDAGQPDEPHVGEAVARARRPTRSASRVLPTPPTPVSVTTRSWRSSGDDVLRRRARARRATSAAAGRPCGARRRRAAAGTRAGGRGARPATGARARRGRGGGAGRRRRARRRLAAPARTSAAVTSDSRIWPPWPDGHDARRPVDRAAAVVVADALDLAGVDAHPHGEPERGEVALGGHGGVDGRPGGVEGGGDAVTQRGEHLAAGVGDRGPQHVEVPARRGRPSPATAPTGASSPRCR